MEPLVLYILAAALVLAGLAGTILPVIPGALLIFGGLFLAAWADGFAHVGWIALTVIGALGLLSWVADFVASVLGAKRVGASPLALLGATIGGIAGIFLGIPGLILGPFVGAVAGELLARGGLAKAGKVGLGTWLGLLVAAIAKVFLAFMMIAAFFIAYLF
jgi:uncharacterized protein YqgC (DUF456 family)